MQTPLSALQNEKRAAQIADAVRFQETALVLTLSFQENEEAERIVRLKSQTAFQIILTKNALRVTVSAMSAPYQLDIDATEFHGANLEIRIAPENFTEPLLSSPR